MSDIVKHTKESVAAVAQRVGKMLHATLPEGIGYVMILTDISGGSAAMNSDLYPPERLAELLRNTADGVEDSACEPDELDG